MLERKSLGAACAVAAAMAAACGSSVTVTVPAPRLTLGASPDRIAQLQSTTLTWAGSDVTGCTAAGAWTGPLPASGTKTVALASAGVFSFALTCTGPGGQVSEVATVLVSVIGPHPLDVALSASPTSTAVGTDATLTWSAPAATSCTASAAWSGTRPVTGSQTVKIGAAGTSSYLLICSDGTGGQGSQQVTVTGLLPSLTLASDHDVVAAGGSATLSWSAQHAASCAASGGWSGNKATSGTEPVSIPAVGSYGFTLTCTDGVNSVVKAVTVKGAGPTVALSAFPSTVAAGKPATLRWQAAFADGCTASGGWSGALAAAGFQTVQTTSPGSLAFHLSCASAGGAAAADAAVTVVAAPAFPPATAYRMTEGHTGALTTAAGAQPPKGQAPLWTRDFGAPVSYPLIAGGLVFVATANTDNTYGNRLFGLDGATGAIVWGPVAVSGTYFGSGFTYENGRLFHFMFDGALRAFDAATGAPRWSAQVPGYWHEGSPNAYGGVVFAVGNGGLSAVDEATGTILWTAPADITDFVSPAVSSEGVFVAACAAVASDPSSGAALWSATPGCSGGFSYSPAVSGGVLYGRTSGTLNLFDARTGVAQGQLGSKAAPAITSTQLFALSSGTLSATRLSDKVQTWTFGGDGALATAPVVVDGTVYVGSTNGSVFGVDAVTGSQTWKGVSPPGISADSENGGPQPPSGPAAGEGLLVFPAHTSLAVWRLQ